MPATGVTGQHRRNFPAHGDDFYGWAVEQGALLRAGRLTEVDGANRAGEIETLGPL